MFSLSGHTALVTGASRGIGKATAKALKELGATVILHGTNEETLQRTADELGGASWVAANLLEENAVERILEKAKGASILVNNAGITRDGLFVRQKAEDWNAVLNVNLNAAVNLARGMVMPMQKAGFGRIVNITSITAHAGNVGQTNYITAKAALTGFTRALSKEVARRGVTVNAVAPGFIETDMTEKLTPEIRENFISQIPAGRFGTAEDVAAAVAFLCTPEAAYITGTTLHANGGLYLG